MARVTFPVLTLHPEMEIAQVQKAMPLCTCCGDVSQLVEERGKRDKWGQNRRDAKYAQLSRTLLSTTFVPYAIFPRKIRKILTTFV